MFISESLWKDFKNSYDRLLKVNLNGQKLEVLCWPQWSVRLRREGKRLAFSTFMCFPLLSSSFSVFKCSFLSLLEQKSWKYMESLEFKLKCYLW